MSNVEDSQEMPGAQDGLSQKWILLGAFAILYIVWGSTYLAIKIAVETMPPFLMATTRFVLAGGALYVIARLRSGYHPTLRDWKVAAIVGSMMIAGGNGIVTYVETWIDSNIAALIVASGPFFALLFSWWGGLQKRPTLSKWMGIAFGFIGVGLLISSSSGMNSEGSLWGYFLVIIAVILWTSASVYSKKNPVQADTWMLSGMQMLCGGITCLIAGALMGEFNTVDMTSITTRSWWAFVYLVIMGSLLGFSAYVYILKHCSPSVAASHAYVNPVVAIFLGWLILGETLTVIGAIGAIIIIASVYELLRQK